MNRDTCNFAMKMSEVTRDGSRIAVKKTAVGKESKAGRFDDLPVVFENGYIWDQDSFTTIRERVNKFKETL